MNGSTDTRPPAPRRPSGAHSARRSRASAPQRSPLLGIIAAVVGVVILAGLAVGGYVVLQNTQTNKAYDSIVAALDAGKPAEARSVWEAESASHSAAWKKRLDARVRAELERRAATFVKVARAGGMTKTDPSVLLVKTFAPETKPIVIKAYSDAVEAYASDAKSSASQADALKSALAGAGLANDPEYKSASAKLERFGKSRAAFAQAQKIEGQKYQSLAAAELYAQVIKEDAGQYAEAQKKIPELKKKAASELVEFKGRVRHIFTHVLIANPKKAAAQPASVSESTDTDHVTPDEFRRMLKQLYDNDYILIDINSMFRVENGRVRKAKLMLPPGKKPIVLSTDDVRYDPRVAGNGFNDKLIIDADGKIAAFTSAKNSDTGKDEISYDNEVFPIVDQFVADHPDFSFKGAKGTLAMTGYQSLFGYRTDRLQGSIRASEIKKAQKIAKVLKANGWNFASHGYAHLHSYAITDEKLRSDAQKWRNEVENVVGPTQVYIWPFGEAPGIGTPKARLLTKEFGFRMFNGVGADNGTVWRSDSVSQDRASVDGRTLRDLRRRYADMFDTREIYDAAVHRTLNSKAGDVK